MKGDSALIRLDEYNDSKLSVALVGGCTFIVTSVASFSAVNMFNIRINSSKIGYYLEFVGFVSCTLSCKWCITHIGHIYCFIAGSSGIHSSKCL